MNYITTTDLRTQSSQLVQSLRKGKKISLVHRSQVIGEISPVNLGVKTFDVEKFRNYVKESKPGDVLSNQDREHIYGKHLEEKYVY